MLLILHVGGGGFLKEHFVRNIDHAGEKKKKTAWENRFVPFVCATGRAASARSIRVTYLGDLGGVVICHCSVVSRKLPRRCLAFASFFPRHCHTVASHFCLNAVVDALLPRRRLCSPAAVAVYFIYSVASLLPCRRLSASNTSKHVVRGFSRKVDYAAQPWQLDMSSCDLRFAILLFRAGMRAL